MGTYQVLDIAVPVLYQKSITHRQFVKVLIHICYDQLFTPFEPIPAKQVTQAMLRLGTKYDDFRTQALEDKHVIQEWFMNDTRDEMW